MQNASSSSRCVKQTTVREDPCDTITATPEGVFGLSSPAPVCEYVTTYDMHRAKVLNERVLGDWQLGVPATRQETTKPEDGTGVSSRPCFVDNSVRFVQLERCRDARALVNAMKH